MNNLQIRKQKELDITLNVLKRNVRNFNQEDNSEDIHLYSKQDIIDLLNIRLDNEIEDRDAYLENYGERDEDYIIEKDRCIKLEQLIKELSNLISD